MKYITFFSKYPFKKYSRKNKEIIYEGTVDKIPTELEKDIMIDKDTCKFIIIYKK